MPSTMALLIALFKDHLISRGQWAARSPDLTPLDFFSIVLLENLSISIASYNDTNVSSRETKKATPQSF